MSNLIEKAFDPASFREYGHHLVDQLADYLSACRDTENMKVLPWKTPEENLSLWDTDFTEPGEEKLKEFFAAVIRHSFHFHLPKNMGHQVVPPAPPAALAELLSALLNNSMAIYEVGPVSSTIEKIVTGWTAAALNMGEKAGGILTSGGTIGNLTCLLAARQRQVDYDIWESGTKSDSSLALMTSAETHYSVARAVKIMGWGEKGIIKIPVNQRREADHHLLEDCLRQAKDEGRQVVAVVGSACTTSTGSYDPLEEMAAFCRKHNLWFHVDGAHGAGAALTQKYKHLIKGLDQADSLVLDFHKMLLCPALTTAVIFKDNDCSYETFSQKASYLIGSRQKENWYDIAQRTLECTKKMMGVKIYALLKAYGSQLFSDYITQAYDLAREFAALIKESSDFQLALEPAANIVCFRWAPAGKNNRQLNKLNAGIRTRLKEEGEFYIVQTDVGDRLYLRVTLMNPFTSKKDFVQLLRRIRETAAALESQSG